MELFQSLFCCYLLESLQLCFTLQPDRKKASFGSFYGTLELAGVFFILVAPFKSTAIVEDNPVCPFNAINVGDGICDEEPNIEECAFDGGDCCLQYKLAPLCRDNCDCNMTVDPDFIDRMLQETNVYIFDNDISDMEILDSYSVEDVVSIEVCSMICLNSNRSLTVNSWTYNEANRKCSCEWLLRSENCVEEYPEGLKKVSELSVGKQSPESRFLMLSKILKCGKLKYK